MHAFTNAYWVIVKRILRYLKAISNHGLHITCSSYFSHYIFIDVGYASSVDDRKSNSG
jgi:hypothetical protein